MIHSTKMCSLLVFLLVTIVSSSLWAAPNDFHLHYLYEGSSARLVQLQRKNFRALSTEYAFSVADPVLSPAETLGIAGFDIGIEFSLPNIPETAEHWKRAVEDERPDNNLFISRIRLRKGLPYSLEIDASVGFIYDSSAILGSIALKWAIVEGFRYAPDFAVRLGMTRVFNSRDLDMFVAGADAILSKQFGIVGTVSLTPFAGYSFLYTRSGSSVLDPTPMNFNDNEKKGDTSNFVFFPENIFGHRVFFGVRLVWFIASVSLEGSFSLPHTDQDGAEMVSSFNMKFSLFF